MDLIDKFYQEEHRICPSEVDMNYNLSLVGIMSLFQDVAFYHTSVGELSRDQLINKYKAFFVLTKMHVKILKPAKWFETVNIATWPTYNKTATLYRDFSIGKNNENYVICNSEWAILSQEGHRLMRVSDFQICADCLEEIKGLDFYKGYLNKNDMEYLYSRRVRNQDLDVNNHVNNVNYNRFILDCFTFDFLSKHDIIDYEIHFVNEAHELDMLDFFMHVNNDGTYIIACYCNDTRIAQAQIKFKL